MVIVGKTVPFYGLLCFPRNAVDAENGFVTNTIADLGRLWIVVALKNG